MTLKNERRDYVLNKEISNVIRNHQNYLVINLLDNNKVFSRLYEAKILFFSYRFFKILLVASQVF